MRIRLIAWTGLLTLVGVLATACASSDRPRAGRSAAPWARDLNEPPPSRTPVDPQVSGTKAALTEARDRASR